TQIDTDMEVLIPDEYVTQIAERYNLYNDLSNLKNEEELEAFKQALIDRLGPIPKEVHHLFGTLKMHWFGKKIGFEVISLKQDQLRGYFIQKKDSKYFQSEQFGKVLAFAQLNATTCNLKEVKGTLRIAVNGVYNLNQAIQVLEAMEA